MKGLRLDKKIFGQGNYERCPGEQENIQTIDGGDLLECPTCKRTWWADEYHPDCCLYHNRLKCEESTEQEVSDGNV